MKKQILSIGKSLSRADQKEIHGGSRSVLTPVGGGVVFCASEGTFQACQSSSDCCGGETCQAITIYSDDGNLNLSGLGNSLGTQTRCVA